MRSSGRWLFASMLLFACGLSGMAYTFHAIMVDGALPWHRGALLLGSAILLMLDRLCMCCAIEIGSRQQRMPHHTLCVTAHEKGTPCSPRHASTD